MQKIKDTLFSVHGAITTIIHVMLFCGALQLWIHWQVTVMGNDVELSVPTATRRK